jgi:flagellar basal body-associated protein FliL
MNKKNTLIIISIVVLTVVLYYATVALIAKQTSKAILDDFVFISDSLKLKNEEFEKKSDSILKEIERMKAESTSVK